jgi:hypothetical protein
MDEMISRYSFWCFLAVLVAIVVLYTIGAILAYNGKPMEALGLGGAGTGLIGILGTFKPRSSGPMNTVNRADNVNQGPNAAPPEESA